MDQSVGSPSSFNESAPLTLPGQGRLFSVFFLDREAASARLVELTDFAIANREGGWAQRAAISRAIALVVPRASEPVAARCAQALALNHLIDTVTTEAFLARRDEAARIVLSEARGVSQHLALQIAAIGTDEEARALTARVDLDDTVIHILLNRRDRPIDILLAENHALSLSRLMLDRMLTRALIDPALSRSLFHRPDLTFRDRAALFLNAAHLQRLSVIEELSAQFPELVGQPQTADRDVITTLDTHLQAHDYAGFVKEVARMIHVDTFQLSVILMEPSGCALNLLAALLSAPDDFVERMLRAWSRPMQQDARKRHDIDIIRNMLTPDLASFILDNILAIAISETVERHTAQNAQTQSV